jgi:hypothetical protein
MAQKTNKTVKTKCTRHEGEISERAPYFTLHLHFRGCCFEFGGNGWGGIAPQTPHVEIKHRH